MHNWLHIIYNISLEPSSHLISPLIYLITSVFLLTTLVSLIDSPGRLDLLPLNDLLLTYGKGQHPCTQPTLLCLS